MFEKVYTVDHFKHLAIKKVTETISTKRKPLAKYSILFFYFKIRQINVFQMICNVQNSRHEGLK